MVSFGILLWLGQPAAAQITAPPIPGLSVAVSNTIALSDPSTTQEELPGLGHKFELLGAMVDDIDPNNPTNDVISVDTTGGVLGFAYRNLPPGIKITALTDQLGLKYYFSGIRSCGGGSPRLVLLVDANGDGQFTQPPDFAANGHVNPPTTVGCPSQQWIYENMTDNGNRWEATPAVFGNTFPYATWDAFVTAVTAAFPNHKVLAGYLLDGESCGFPFLPDCGKAYYDLVTIENRTLENRQDTVKNVK